MTLTPDDDYFDLSATKEMKDIKNLLMKVLQSLSILTDKITIIEDRISTNENYLQEILSHTHNGSRSLSNIITKVDDLDHLGEDTDKNVQDIGSKISSLILQIDIRDKRVDKDVHKLDEHIKEIDKKVERMTVQHGNANHRMINAMLRKNDPLPFSISSCVQNIQSTDSKK